MLKLDITDEHANILLRLVMCELASRKHNFFTSEMELLVEIELAIAKEIT